MTDKSQQPSDVSVPSKTRPRNEARRRLLRGGIGTTPLLLTLVSRPVLGQLVCRSPSGFVSMPTSAQGTPTMCIGRTPGYWKQSQHFDDWLPPYYPTTTTGPGGHT